MEESTIIAKPKNNHWKLLFEFYMNDMKIIQLKCSNCTANPSNIAVKNDLFRNILRYQTLSCAYLPWYGSDNIIYIHDPCTWFNADLGQTKTDGTDLDKMWPDNLTLFQPWIVQGLIYRYITSWHSLF